MIQKLFIQNYALIDQLELEFGDGLNIVTGETGAGKSIVLGALSLVLGSRADTAALLDKSKKCIVEARFGADKNQLENFFSRNELDFETPVIVRREISSEGKSRSFINDTPVTLAQLKEISGLLVDIHSQHETLFLNKSGFQLSVVDAFAKHHTLLMQYRQQYETYRALAAELLKLEEEDKKSKSDLDYYRFLFDELDEIRLVPGEQEKLESELRALAHAEEIKSGLDEAEQMIAGNEDNLLSRINQLLNGVGASAKYDAKLNEITARIKSLQIEMKDIDDEIGRISSEVNVDPGRVESLNSRLNFIYRLQQKHRVKSEEELLKIRDELEAKLLGISSSEEKIKELSRELKKQHEKVIHTALEISRNRNKAIPVIEEQITKLLREVSLPNAVLKIENTVLQEQEFTSAGIDQVRFLFSANKGVAYADISKVASGGELSRLMLCIKSAVAKLMAMPTIIFDEIDTGISGETAMSVGKVLKSMSKHHQLIAITHLPQIAGRGEQHYFVYKEVSAKKTFTKVRVLTADERIVEIAKMLSGEKPSAGAIENARELLKQ